MEELKLNYRAFKQSAQRRLRSIAEAEFKGAVKELSDEGFGSVQTLRIARACTTVPIFYKKKPTDPSLQPWAFDIAQRNNMQRNIAIPAMEQSPPICGSS